MGLRIALADDAVLLREGLTTLLQSRGFTVTGAVGTAPELLAVVERTRPQVALVDIRMPPTHTDEGLQAAEAIGQSHPEVGVLVLSQYLDPGFAMALLQRRTRGRGYLLKDRVSRVDVLIGAIRAVATGESYVDPSVVQGLMGNGTNSRLSGLSQRELEVLALMAEGRSNSGISSALFLSGKTVETHVRNILMKLRIAEAPDDHRRVLAVLEYLRGR